MSDVSTRIKAIVEDRLGVDGKDVVPQARFIQDLGADSLDAVELTMDFEKEFNLAIPDEDAEKLLTIGETISYIEGRLKS